MKRLIFIFVLLLSMVGCSPTLSWELEYEPVTQAERDTVARHVEAAIVATKRDMTISGSDQDWDDYAAVVYRQAIRTNCIPRMFEYSETTFGIPKRTGRWKYVEEVQINQEPRVETTTTR